MLLGGGPFVPRLGCVSKIEFQKRVDRHFLDDLVLTLEHEAREWQCSFSVKSNTQFGATTAPQSFVQAAWEMFLHENTDRFVVSRDVLGLVVAPLADPPRTPLLRELLPKARHQESSALAGRLLSDDPDARAYVSENVRKLFRSFSCPETLAEKHSVDAATTAELLKHVMVLEFDFGNEPSRDESHSVQLLQGLLESGTTEDAQALWLSLLAIVRRENEPGGYLDREKLLDEIRRQHRLVAAPDFASDWKKLTEWGRETLETVVDTIGGSLRLPRDAFVSQIRDQLSVSKSCGIIGPSGVGKSVVAKRAVAAIGGNLPVLWFAPEEFTSDGFDQLPSRLQLQHDLATVLRSLPTQSGILVLDGLERVNSDAAWRRLARLLNGISNGVQTGTWLVLFTCQSERWESVQIRLLRSGVDPHGLGLIQLPVLSAEDLQQVWSAFPSLQRLVHRRHVQDILRRPKVLDILAAHARAMGAANPATWAGESDLIRWFWQSVVAAPDDGPSRVAMLQTLAERQADQGEVETPVAEVDAGNVQFLRGLERDGVCRLTSSDRIRFDHDLIGDWCRQRLLLAKEATLDHYLADRHFNPNWHKAIRLYGLHLLESGQGVEAWHRARNSLQSVADLFLDSVAMAADSRSLLEKLWPSLSEERGRLLQRLLVRFLNTATYPDPVAAWIGEKAEPTIAGWLRANIRRPLWPYWLGMLQFLHDHVEDVIAYADLEVARVAEIWLNRSGQEWPLRREAAELALAVGESTWRRRIDHPYGRDDDVVKRYSAALAAAGELPDEVSDLALRAAARRLAPDVESGTVGKYSAPGSEVVTHTAYGGKRKREQPAPWPDGPLYRVDEAFRQACLSGAALLGLMTSRPSVAAEAILAVIIEERRPNDDDGRHLLDPPENEVFSHLHQFFPVLYDRGPFGVFLLAAPDEAVDCVIRLVNFATNRWADRFDSATQSLPCFRLFLDSEEKSYLGDGNVCTWYRGGAAPGPVACALMAVEHWMYERLRQGENIDDACARILQQGESTAFLGLLWEVARFEPKLLEGPLRPLLSCPEMHEWEIEALTQGAHRMGLIADYLHPEETRNKVRKWEEMAHRAKHITQVAIRLFLFDEPMAGFFEQTRDYWQGRVGEFPEGSPLRDYTGTLLAQFDRSNWRTVKDKNGVPAEVYVPPPELQKRAKEAEQDLQDVLPLRMIFHCRQALDGESSIDGEQIGQFYRTVQELNDRETTDGEEAERVARAVVAGIAVLTEKHWDWLNEDGTRADWCRSTLLALLSSPPQMDLVFSEYDRSGLSFEDFAARAVVPFWADNLADSELREAVAHRAMAVHYSAVTFLTRAAFGRRQELGEDFDRLIAFLLRWAVLREDIHRTRYQEHASVDVEGWFATHGQSFVDGSMPADWSNWGEIAVSKGERRPASWRHGSRSRDDVADRGFVVRPHIDLHLIMSAFGGILHLDQAESDDERRKWLACWHQVLVCATSSQQVLDSAGRIILDADAEAGDVYESDRWVADRLAMLVVQMTPEESPQTIWQRIVDLCPPGHRWIEAFLQSWLIYGVHSGKSDACIAQWRAMIDYAMQHPIWQDRQKCWPHWDDFWLHLLGMDQWAVKFWRDEDGPIVEQMADCFGRWIPQNLKDRWIARAFVVWLRLPAAEPLRLPAVRWLLPVANDADDYWWDDERLTETLAEVLDQSWRDDHEMIAADAHLYREFRELVALLVQRQNAIAMDLQDRMASYGHG